MSKSVALSLTAAERQQLEKFVNAGQAQARQIKHAHVLLKLAAGWSQVEIAQAFELSARSVIRIKQRFATVGLEAALKDKVRSGTPRKLDGDHQALLVATACSAAPAGHQRWTLRMLAARLVELEVVDSLSHESVRTVLKKTNLNPGKSKSGAFRL